YARRTVVDHSHPWLANVASERNLATAPTNTSVIVLAGDISIGYDDDGRGLPVVFVHGFPHNRSLWAPQLGGLAAPCRVIALDLRGFGESTLHRPIRWTASPTTSPPRSPRSACSRP